MTIKTLKKILDLYPEHFQVVISNPFWLDKENDVYGIEDLPITATNQNKADGEIRLFFQENISKEFPNIPLSRTQTTLKDHTNDA